MRKLILFIAIITSLIIAACEKNKDKNSTPSLEGKWELVNTIYLEVENGVEVSDYNYTGIAGDYIDFRSDHKVYSHVDGFDDVSGYTLLNNNKVDIEGDTLEIRSLTKASVTLYEKSYTNLNSYEENTVNLKR